MWLALCRHGKLVGWCAPWGKQSQWVNLYCLSDACWFSRLAGESLGLGLQRQLQELPGLWQPAQSSCLNGVDLEKLKWSPDELWHGVRVASPRNLRKIQFLIISSLVDAHTLAFLLHMFWINNRWLRFKHEPHKKATQYRVRKLPHLAQYYLFILAVRKISKTNASHVS